MPSTNASENPSSACKVVWEIRCHLQRKIFRIISTISISLTGFVCALTLSMYSEKNSFLMFYIISISDIIFLNVFAKELFPDIALQLWERGEQSWLEEVARKVLVQHVPAAFISGTIGTCKKSWACCITCSYFSTHFFVRRHTNVNVKRYTSVGWFLHYPPVKLQCSKLS